MSFKKPIYWGYALAMVSAPSFADFSKDRQAIMGMAGCYEVGFEFTEVKTKPGVKASKPYKTSALEWVTATEKPNGAISLQHILKVGFGFHIKHWRQEWSYEAAEKLEYVGDKMWESISFSPEPSSWTQKVYQVDDGPRYECSSVWDHDGENPEWSCKTYAPLPRREYSKRSDYHIMNRRNTHIVTPDGWRHEQNNDKLIKASPDDQAIWVGSEIGKNTYKKVAAKKCESMEKWWHPRRQLGWSLVQKTWERIIGERDFIQIEKEAILRSRLNKHVDQFSRGPMDGKARSLFQNEIYETITGFVVE